MQREFHSASTIFPLLKGVEFDALVESIRTRGLLNPITLHPDGSVIDGRNRYRACLEAGVEPRFQTWDGKGSLTE
jgi:ParB-like chromosome segregation protein Spo0J